MATRWFLAPVLVLFACEAPGAPAPAASSSPAITSRGSSSASASASAAPSASAAAPPSASAAPADACLPGARRNEEEHFCIKLPDGFRPQAHQETDFVEEALYDGDEDTIALTWQPLTHPAPHLQHIRGCSDAKTLKDMAKTPSKGETLVASGDLEGGGFWFDMDIGESKRRVCSAIKTKTHLVSCYYQVPAGKIAVALSTCQSLRAID